MDHVAGNWGGVDRYRIYLYMHYILHVHLHYLHYIKTATH